MSRTDLTPSERDELQALSALNDEAIDVSDIPEIAAGNWKHAVRGLMQASRDALNEPADERGETLQQTCFAAASMFGKHCAEFRDGSSWKSVDPLGLAINTLMTELWDQNFTQSEIRRAFEDALRDMDRHAANRERRSG